MTSVGLDVSYTATGIASVAPGGKIHPCVFKTTPKNGNDIERAILVREAVLRACRSADIVVIEDVYVPRKSKQIGSAFRLIMLAGVVRAGLWEAGIPFHVVTTLRLKQFVTGKTQPNKAEMLKWVFKRWEVDTPSHDEADAVGLAMLGKYLTDGGSRTELTKTQLSVVEKESDKPLFCRKDARPTLF